MQTSTFFVIKSGTMFIINGELKNAFDVEKRVLVDKYFMIQYFFLLFDFKKNQS